MNNTDWDVEFLGNLPGLHFTAHRFQCAVAEEACKMDGRYIDPLVNHQFHG
jgi:hypothetical protein